ncbi:MAG: hypothetical protein JRJ50_12020 [Deltaproteobacteria bacterium]|nr:hypothetical protein [Deltaproteobacteria bacterium]MBW2342477.1 hypothetical protein [Deltaproteobacteria bacterium]
MRYVDLFAELAAETTGASKDLILAKMLVYEQHMENESILYQEISPEDADKLRDAARADPSGFSRSFEKGFADVLSMAHANKA